MKLGIISDVHGNLPALMKVLEHMESQGVDKKICLGDTVGYGPYPNECVETVVSNFNFILMGNHDEAAFNSEVASYMNPLARQAIEWTASRLTESNKDTLKNLEYGYVTEEKIMFVHGSPRTPFAYINTMADALNAFANPMEDFEIAFVGHTHVPVIWQVEDHQPEYIRPRFIGSSSEVGQFECYLGIRNKSIVNVGSVGQPRDYDPRATYAIFDTDFNHLKIFKVPYPTDRTIAKMQQANLPTDLWLRLMYGQ